MEKWFEVPGGGFGSEALASSNKLTDVRPLPLGHFAHSGKIGQLTPLGVFSRGIRAGAVLGMYSGHYMTDKEAEDEQAKALAVPAGEPGQQPAAAAWRPRSFDYLHEVLLEDAKRTGKGKKRARFLIVDGARQDGPALRRYWGGCFNSVPPNAPASAANVVAVTGVRGPGFAADSPLRDLQLPFIVIVAACDIAADEEVSARTILDNTSARPGMRHFDFHASASLMLHRTGL